MRLYFQDPQGKRLAIDTERREYCAETETPDITIPDSHRFIAVDDNAFYIILGEADFCGWSYSSEFLKDHPAPPIDNRKSDDEPDDEPF